MNPCIVCGSPKAGGGCICRPHSAAPKREEQKDCPHCGSLKIQPRAGSKYDECVECETLIDFNPKSEEPTAGEIVKSCMCAKYAREITSLKEQLAKSEAERNEEWQRCCELSKELHEAEKFKSFKRLFEKQRDACDKLQKAADGLRSAMERIAKNAAGDELFLYEKVALKAITAFDSIVGKAE